MEHEALYYIKKYKLQISLWSAFALIVLTVISIAYNQQIARDRQGKVAVQIQVVPSDALVTIGDTKVTSSGTAYVQPGSYKVTVKKQGFSDYTKVLDVHQESLPSIYVGLSGSDKDAKKWEDDHADQYSVLNRLEVERAAKFNHAQITKNEIIRILPINDPYFTVSYMSDGGDSIHLIVSGVTAKYRMFALDYIRQKGYEPTDYKIEFKGFKNPLEVKS